MSTLAQKDKTLERILVMIYVIMLAGIITAGGVLLFKLQSTIQELRQENN